MSGVRPNHFALARHLAHCARRVSDPQERARLLAAAREHGRLFTSGIPKRPPAASVTLRRSARARDDYDMMDGDRNVGRIFLDDNGAWFWGVDFMLTHRKSYGTAESREGAMVAFKAEYERWQREKSDGH